MSLFPSGYSYSSNTGGGTGVSSGGGSNARYDQVNQAFRSTLGRDAGANEIEQWAKDFIDTGRGVDAITKTLMGGSEYKDNKFNTFHEEFAAPAPTELEKQLSGYLQEMMGQGVEGVFSGEFGGQLLDVLKGYLEPNREAFDIDRAYQKIAEEVINPASKATEEAMLNRFGAQGITKGGLPADAMGQLYNQRGQSLASAMRDLLLENENLTRQDIATALQGFGIGEDFLKNIMSQSNQLVSTRGSLDSAGANRALQEYLGEMGFDLQQQQIDLNKWIAEQNQQNAEDASDDALWGKLFDIGSKILLGSDFGSSSGGSSWLDSLFGSSSSPTIIQGQYPKALPTTSLFKQNEVFSV